MLYLFSTDDHILSGAKKKNLQFLDLFFSILF